MAKTDDEKGKQTDRRRTGPSGQELSAPAHALASAQVVAELRTDPLHGLSPEEARSRLDVFGRNELGEAEGVQPVRILAAQIANAMTLVLLMAMAVSYGIGSYIEGGVVTAVILLNVVVGFVQEYSAEKTMDSLRSLSSPTATVVRGAEAAVVPSGELVPGDVVEVKVGDTIPADIRLLEAKNFETDEALLTGESLPVRKAADDVFAAHTGPGDRLNVAYSSSTVTKGRARGVVFATGGATEIGAIASALQQKDAKVRPVKRGPDGRAGPHRYLEAYTLTLSDAVGRFLGVNVGTPLQRKLSKLALLLFGVAVVCAVVCLAANRFDGRREVVIYAVATGLSMIPASLVVVLTITMAAGTKRMVRRHVIVRNLKSLEALGAVTDICSDKTGTLTQGKMTARAAWVPSLGTLVVENADEVLDPTRGDVRLERRPPADVDFGRVQEDAAARPGGNAPSTTSPRRLLEDGGGGGDALREFLCVATLANLATIDQVSGRWVGRGDPTELAIQVFARRFGWIRAALTRQGEGAGPVWTDVAELPFDSEVKRMSVVMRNQVTGAQHVFTKGAVERVVQDCAWYCRPRCDDDDDDDDGAGAGARDEGAAVPVTDAFRAEVLRNAAALARRGLRVLCLASRRWDDGDGAMLGTEAGGDVDRRSLESGLTFRGLIGLYDPPRPESAGAVRECHRAGIAVHMLTGDHPETAQAIAAEVGILPPPRSMDRVSRAVARAMVMTAADFDALDDGQIDALPVLPLVVARCAPSTKVRMIEALHRRRRFCAMTGDGVNDSPSLRRADVGIAMGQAGSDVAKDASDIVLADDNFASIVAAVEEGRRIFDNIQKFVLHVLAENVAQAATLLVGLAFKDRHGLSVFPLAPVEVVWIIMATSGLPDMGLGFERAAPDIMARPPRSLATGIFTAEFLVDMVVYGLWIAALCLASFSLVVFAFGGGGNLGDGCNEAYSASCDVVFRARATAFACLTWFALFLAWEMIDMRRSFFRMQPGSPRYLTQWMHDVRRNPFLFWAVVVGFATLFPTLYIPVVNKKVFKHAGIGWEWSIVFVAAVLFFAGVEAWKGAKRAFFRRRARQQRGRAAAVAGEDSDLEQRVFGEYFLGQESSSADSLGDGAATKPQ